MENQELEYKESWRDEYLETLSAFANTQGGKLIIGINDKNEIIGANRNPLLASVFYYAGFIETWGRGTIKIIDECKKQGLPEPDFENNSGVMKVTIYKDIYNEENLKKMGLSERQIKAVKYIIEHGQISRSQYVELMKISPRTAHLDLNDLVKKKIAIHVGKGRSVRYKLHE
ncbi:MAG: ATP-binding protein [Spirochaetota bacterium]